MAPREFIKRSTAILKMAASALSGRPIWAFVWITRQCNQCCSHCYVWNNSIPHMDMATFRQVIDKLRDLGVLFVSIFGGEPTSHPDLIRMIDYAAASGRRVYLNTDLTATETDVVTQTIKAGVDILSFSLDKIEPATWNKRATSRIDNKLNALLALRRQDYSCSLHCNVTWHKMNLKEGREVVQYLLDKEDIEISVRPAVYPFPAPNTGEMRRKLLLTEEDHIAVSELVKWVIDKKRAGYPIVNPYPYLEAFPDFVRQGGSWDCGANRDILSIDVDGAVLQCSYFLKEVPQPFERIPLRVEDLSPQRLAEARVISKLNLAHCNSHCYSPAYYCTDYYRRHPLEVLRHYFRS
ncbi:MAG: radical SAM protein [Armatimonadota bacterium]|nr:radical SAM protein [Armatimonadota bacterium]